MRFLLISSVMLLLPACALFWQPKPETSAETLWQHRATQLQQLDEWSFRGRTLIQQGKEGWNAGVSWEQKQDSFKIRLTGPFSQGAVELTGDSQQVEMLTSDGERFTAETPEQLLEEVLGWRLPVSALRDWVRGLPYNGEAVTLREIDDEGHLLAINQAGWQVEFLRYVPFAGLQIPDKVFIKRDDLSVRLVISEWDQP
ncbi:MAG TPA: lipoprotein insertase outer membrane protein LolB [Methylophaga sp.]|nr:lipoprotein insertase outer membrane protein LolB [Methylophaga sp.]